MLREKNKLTQKQDNSGASSTFAPEALLRLVFREVLSGDRRKFQAKSNDTKSGGGARDFRFTPYGKFDGIFEKMLTVSRTEERTRGKKKTMVNIYTSTVNVVKADGSMGTKTIEFEPPTTRRPNEGRLTRLNHYSLEVPSNNEGRILLLLYQTGDKRLWLTFATENQLQQGVWDKNLTDLLLNCLNAPRGLRHAAQGFHDLALGNRFCKSKGNKA